MDSCRCLGHSSRDSEGVVSGERIAERDNFVEYPAKFLHKSPPHLPKLICVLRWADFIFVV